MHTELSKIHALRIMPGQDLRGAIEAYVQNENIEAGWIQSCVGSLTQVHLRFANQPIGTKFNGYFEIVSLVGTVSSNGCHLHLACSNETGHTVGGHLLLENLVYTTAEIIIGEGMGLAFSREHDGTTPWKELQIKTTSNAPRSAT